MAPSRISRPDDNEETARAYEGELREKKEKWVFVIFEYVGRRAEKKEKKKKKKQT